MANKISFPIPFHCCYCIVVSECGAQNGLGWAVGDAGSNSCSVMAFIALLGDWFCGLA